MDNHKKGFTLIELLVVIAVIAILAVVVVLVLNPAELLKQSRDSSRLSDAATIKSALSIYSEDVGGSMGSSSVVYVSLPDPAATTTAGDQCQGLSLPGLTAATYHCAASSTFRNVNGLGWIPINFTSSSIGSPVGSLPIDPINTTSSGEFYTYTTNGTQWETTMAFESSKNSLTEASDGGPYSDLYEQGTNLALAPNDFYGQATFTPSKVGLVGYWNFEEGSGSTASDTSGNGNNGTWSGVASGTSGYYSAGKVGSWAGAFSGVNTRVLTGTSGFPIGASARSQFGWVYITACNTAAFGYGNDASRQQSALYPCSTSGSPSGHFYFVGYGNDVHTSTLVPTLNAWHFIGYTYATGALGVTLYLDGQSDFELFGDSASALNTQLGSSMIGGFDDGTNYFSGFIDDVRLYNRVLTPAEIQEMYNTEK